MRHIMVKLGETFGILFQMGPISGISMRRSLAVFFVIGRNPRPVRRGAQ